MQCKCGQSIPDNAKFCPECGTAAPKPEVLEIVKDEYPPMLTAAQAMKLLQCSRWKLYDMARKKEIPCFPIGSNKRFLRDELFKWARDACAR